MSGIRLDWQIESDRVKEKKEREDPQLALARRVGFLRLILFIVVIVAIASVIIWLVQRRFEQIDQQLQRLLIDTVEAEAAALRVGDQSLFLDLQRSATDSWLNSQQASFLEYQQLKSDSDIQLTGNVLESVIDGSRARVHVEEIIDGVSYTRIWFYWRYEDGWHHVPPDYQFWGDARVLERNTFTIRYREVDELLAQQMGEQLERWFNTSCAAIDCETVPYMTVDIGNQIPEIAWVPGDAWQMTISSPYVDRARTDQPFNTEYQIEVATLLANRLVDNSLAELTPVYPADAYYLRSSVISWLVGRFVQLDTNAHLITSLAQNYGDSAVGGLVEALQPQSSMAIFSQITGVADVSQANLDWRDFIAWRLAAEDELIQRQDQANFMSLYDPTNSTGQQVAINRFNNPQPAREKVVLKTESVTGSTPPQLNATVRYTDTGEEVVIQFNLVDNVWRRSN